MATQYTSGPWVYRKCISFNGQQERFYIAGAKCQGYPNSPNVAMVICHPLETYPEANARLIAAAPELLKALEHLECEASAELDPNTSLNMAILEARKAIKKAIGE